MSLLIVGDLFPCSLNNENFAKGNIASLFDDKIISMFLQADYSVCNLEGALTDSLKPALKAGPSIRSSKKSVITLQKLGVSCVSMANNHSMDYGAKGYFDTCDTLKENGIEYFGCGDNIETIHKSKSLIIDGRKITLYAVSETLFNVPEKDKPGANLYDEYQVCTDLRSLKKECDYLIVLYHGGTEFFWYNTPQIRQRFHRMADNGADVVIAQHTHCIGLRENYNGAYLLYGQGNFLFGRTLNQFSEQGLLLELNFPLDGGLLVKEYLLRHGVGTVSIDSEQDFTQLNTRWDLYNNGELFQKEYKEFCQNKMIEFFTVFRGRNLVDRLIKKVLGNKSWLKFVKKRYTDTQLLRIISICQGEEHREEAICGLQNILNE